MKASSLVYSTCSAYPGPFACELYAMTGSLFGNTSIWTMVIIALDRYKIIVKVSNNKNNN